MPHSNILCYAFDHFQFDVDQRVLTRAGKAVSLTPKATDILILLLRNAGQLVEKDELMKEVWPNTFVEEANVTQNIFTLRRALGETESGKSYIETVARRGYRFVADVTLAKTPARGVRNLRDIDDETLVQSPPSLAVLPFMNATKDEKFEYLAEGITDNLTNNLSRIDKLRIISRSAVFRLRSGQTDFQEIGQALGVDAILSGKVQMRGSNLAVSAELIEVNSGWQLWGESFDLAVKDILEVQDEIARQISSTLRLKLTGEEEKRITTRYTENSAAYQAYLEGRYHWSKYTQAGIEKAIVHFREAIELDPNYALAYSGIVDCHLRLATNYLPPEGDLSSLAQNLTAEFQPDLSANDEYFARLSLRQEWDWKVAERELRRASELRTNYPSVHQWQFVYQRTSSLVNSASAASSSDSGAKERRLPTDYLSQFRLCRNLTPAEEIQIICTVAREQTNVGNFTAACLIFGEWWTPGKWPKLNHLDLYACADLLFTLGMLAGNVASARRVSSGQKYAQALLNGAIAFSEHIGSRWLVSEARVELARSYYREGLFDLAGATSRQALLDIGCLDNELKGVCLVLLGAIYRDAGRLGDSINRLKEAAEVVTSPMSLISGRYHHEIATTLKESAVLSFSEEHSRKSWDNFHAALFALEAIGNHRHSAAAENNLGYLLLNLKQHQDSELHLLRAKRFFSRFGDDVRSAQVNDTLARLYIETGQLTRADENISNAVRVLETTDEDGLLAEALTTKGIILFKTGRAGRG